MTDTLYQQERKVQAKLLRLKAQQMLKNNVNRSNVTTKSSEMSFQVQEGRGAQETNFGKASSSSDPAKDQSMQRSTPPTLLTLGKTQQNSRKFLTRYVQDLTSDFSLQVFNLLKQVFKIFATSYGDQCQQTRENKGTKMYVYLSFSLSQRIQNKEDMVLLVLANPKYYLCYS